jgi:two-component system OmpR family response regulator
MQQTVGRVLVLDDAATRRQIVCKRLGDAGYTVLAGLLDDSLGPVIDTFEPDVILARLDSRPTETVRFLRRGREIPVVMLASADAPMDARVSATRARVDSIFTEPLDSEELLARVDILMEHRRSRRVLNVYDLSIDRVGHVVRRNGTELQLTATEYNLLLDLATNVGQVLSKRRLLERVWGFDEYDVNVVEVHMSALRRKLEALGPRLIETVRGFGYVIRHVRDRSNGQIYHGRTDAPLFDP